MYIRILFVLLCIASVSLLTAQAIDWNITGAGARAAGFGGAFIGVADDATAIVWNPAGLTQLEKPEASIVGKLVSEDMETKDESDGTSETTSQTHGVMNFLSAASPFGESKIVGAISWQQEIDGFYKQDTTERTGSVDAFSVGAAMPFGKFFSMGLAGNIWKGKMKSKYIYSGTDYSGTTDFSGFNMALGAMLDFTTFSSSTPFKVGLTIRTPFVLTENYDGNDEKYESKIHMPIMIGFGSAYRFNDSFTMAMDFESRAYSNSKIDSTKPANEGYLSNYDLNQLRLGAEYLILCPGFRIPLRCGIQTVPTIYGDLEGYEASGYTTKEQVVGSGFSIGTGFITDRFSFDITISGQSYEQKQIDELINTTYSKAEFYISGILYF